MTNCCEHAFPNRAGTIQIYFKIQEHGIAELMVIDDGVGLSSERPIRQSFGLSVVNRLVNQLEGSFSMENNFPELRCELPFRCRPRSPYLAEEPRIPIPD